MKIQFLMITMAAAMFGTAAAEARDLASGIATGKRQHVVKRVKAGPLAGISARQLARAKGAIVSPRDAASGLPTGKRMHKPLVVKKRIDKMVPLAAKRALKLKSKANVKNN